MSTYKALLILVVLFGFVLAEGCENLTGASKGACEFMSALARGATIVKPKMKRFAKLGVEPPEDANKEWYEHLERVKNQPKYPPPPSIEDYKPRVVEVNSTMPDVEIHTIPEPEKRGFEVENETYDSAYYRAKKADETWKQTQEHIEQHKEEKKDVITAIFDILINILRTII
ncbi:MAG: hypothetical protein J7K68_00390 [Candidatus Diapherotrites archaeon]|nr:hypothetical protein [Candidatus Diapherotrites archaeon]